MLVGNKTQHTAVKRSLVLAGGGMRAAYQAGVLLALQESGMKFTHVDGTSGGIFNAAMLASGLDAREIAERWRTLNMKHFVSGVKFKNYLRPFSMAGYADADNIRHKVFPHLGIDPLTIRNNRAVNATFNVCNYSNKSVEAIQSSDILEDHLIAGVSLPIFMPALKIGNDWYTDAVWIKDANLLEGVRQESQELWLIWAIGNPHTYLPGAFNQYVHMIEMSANGALLEEYRTIDMINREIISGPSAWPQMEAVKLFLIKSPDPLPLDPDLFFNKINTRELINLGYEHAKEFMKLGPVPQMMDANATKSRNPGAVFSFRATFSGMLLWDTVETKVVFYTYYSFSLSDDEQVLTAVSSIFIDALAQEIPGYGHRVSRTYHTDHTLLESEAKILIKGEEHVLKSTIKLYNPLDMLMGTGLKKTNISLTRASGQSDTLVLQGVLYQTAWERLKACYFARVKSENGSNGGLALRYKMISKLINKENMEPVSPRIDKAGEGNRRDLEKNDAQE